MAKAQYLPSEVSAPGETLSELMEERGMKWVDLSARIGYTPKHIAEVVKGSAPLNADFALALENVFLVPARFWLTREAGYREFLSRSQRLAEAEAHVNWARLFPVRDLREWQLIPEDAREGALVEALLQFLGISSTEEFQTMWGRLSPSFRRSRTLATNEHALAAWLRAGELWAQRVQTNDYDEHKFRVLLPELRSLTLLSADEFAPRLILACASVGVAVVFVPEFLGSHASGATRWLNPFKPLIQLSLRYRTDDILWFSFFHEACHILYHSKKSTFLEDSGKDRPEEEEEADRFARDTLIDAKDYLAFAKPKLSGAEVCSFAQQRQIAPGIVVGRLQHDGYLPRTHLNGLKRKLAWKLPTGKD